MNLLMNGGGVSTSNLSCDVCNSATNSLNHQRFYLLSQFDKGKKSCRCGLDYKHMRRIQLKDITSKVVAQGSFLNNDSNDKTKLSSSDHATTTNL
ncbi:hypothetical protein F2Q69_00053702 [Brassica cretica]|uniref:Uncharacterized protein n=1 Tax=Brassica cretica TaxID=69181 RepID=A0A8S9MWW1_BRACR|nr:hypothetical protein F2Q69_00053702 [Brassica cretica]